MLSCTRLAPLCLLILSLDAPVLSQDMSGHAQADMSGALTQNKAFFSAPLAGGFWIGEPWSYKGSDVFGLDLHHDYAWGLGVEAEGYILGGVGYKGSEKVYDGSLDAQLHVALGYVGLGMLARYQSPVRFSDAIWSRTGRVWMVGATAELSVAPRIEVGWPSSTSAFPLSFLDTHASAEVCVTDGGDIDMECEQRRIHIVTHALLIAPPQAWRQSKCRGNFACPKLHAGLGRFDITLQGSELQLQDVQIDAVYAEEIGKPNSTLLGLGLGAHISKIDAHESIIPRIWAEAVFPTGVRRASPADTSLLGSRSGYALRLASWQRIHPLIQAIDAGAQLTFASAWTFGNFTLDLQAEGVLSERQLGPGTGSILPLGRFQAGFDSLLGLGFGFSGFGTFWSEYSDRPQRLANSSQAEMQASYGVELGLRWQGDFESKTHGHYYYDDF